MAGAGRRSVRHARRAADALSAQHVLIMSALTDRRAYACAPLLARCTSSGAVFPWNTGVRALNVSRIAALFGAFATPEKREPCDSPCDSQNAATCGRAQKSRQVAAGECFRLAGPTGLEPATSGVTGRRSNQLNYDPAVVGNRANCVSSGSIPPERRAS
jgi:hypothetical protein